MRARNHLIAVIGLGLSLTVAADVVELKNGTTVNGTYSGGSPGVVKINTATGVQTIETAQIVALTFTGAAGAPAAAAPAGAAPPAAAPPAAAASTVTIPAGTVLMVRMMDSVSSKNKAGSAFATKLETDVAGIKAGTVVHGRVQSSTQAGRAMGQSTIDLRLTQIVVNGQAVPIMTSGYTDAGQRSGAKAVKGAAAGAAIGAIAGDAGKGAAIGAVGGAMVRGQSITIAPGTLLEFTLSQPVTVPAAQ